MGGAIKIKPGDQITLGLSSERLRIIRREE
jgi:hypothetical protein